MALRQPDRSLRSLINLTILSAEISAVVLLIALLTTDSTSYRTVALCPSIPNVPATSHMDAVATPPPRQSDGPPNSSLHPQKGVDIIHQIWPNLHPDASEVHPSQVFMARTARKCLLSGSQGGLQGLFFHTSTPPPPRPPIFQLP